MSVIYFSGPKEDYFFLSNFYPAPVHIDGKAWPTNEHYFQAMKTADHAGQEQIRLASTPHKSKQLGRKVSPLRSDWEEVKVDVMRRCCREKFLQ